MTAATMKPTGRSGLPSFLSSAWLQRWLDHAGRVVSALRVELMGVAAVLVAVGVAVAALRWRRGRAAVAARGRWVMVPTDTFGSRGLGEELLRFGHMLANTRGPARFLTPSSSRGVRIRLTSASGDLAVCLECPGWLGSAVASALPAEVELQPVAALLGATPPPEPQPRSRVAFTGRGPGDAVEGDADDDDGGEDGAGEDGTDMVEREELLR